MARPVSKSRSFHATDYWVVKAPNRSANLAAFHYNDYWVFDGISESCGERLHKRQPTPQYTYSTLANTTTCNTRHSTFVHGGTVASSLRCGNAQNTTNNSHALCSTRLRALSRHSTCSPYALIGRSSKKSETLAGNTATAYGWDGWKTLRERRHNGNRLPNTPTAH